MSQHAQRHVLRPEHFTLAPHLLGLPLASPARRLAALFIDLLLVAILARAGGVFLLSIAAAWAFFRFASRASTPTAAGRVRGRRRTWLLRAAGAFILFLLVREGWERAIRAGATIAGFTGDRPPANPVQATVGGMVALHRAADPVQADSALQQAVRGLRATGASDADIRESLREVVEDSDKPWLAPMVDSLFPAPQTLPVESLAVWHAAALADGDSAAADSLAPQLASVLARDSLDELRGRVTELQEAVDRERERAEEAEERGLLAGILQFLDELGIGFGWTGLYFTALTTLWKGQTAGKRLMGVRVVRLNGEPMTLWMSFERFGGYAAGLVTGLLGFAQVLWDRNRQAIHDKITETVVVREFPGVPTAAVPASEARPRYRAPTG